MNISQRVGRITVDRINATLRNVVAFYGPAHRDTCGVMFDPAGRPTCLVGQILARWGLTKEHLGGANDTKTIVGSLELDIEPVAAAYLFALQKHNDRRGAWGDAATGGWKTVESMYWMRSTENCVCVGCGGDYWRDLMAAFVDRPLPERVVLDQVTVDRTFSELVPQMSIFPTQWTTSDSLALTGS